MIRGLCFNTYFLFPEKNICVSDVRSVNRFSVRVDKRRVVLNWLSELCSGAYVKHFTVNYCKIERCESKYATKTKPKLGYVR